MRTHTNTKANKNYATKPPDGEPRTTAAATSEKKKSKRKKTNKQGKGAKLLYNKKRNRAYHEPAEAEQPTPSTSIPSSSSHVPSKKKRKPQK